MLTCMQQPSWSHAGLCLVRQLCMVFIQAHMRRSLLLSNPSLSFTCQAAAGIIAAASRNGSYDGLYVCLLLFYGAAGWLQLALTVAESLMIVMLMFTACGVNDMYVCPI